MRPRRFQARKSERLSFLVSIVQVYQKIPRLSRLLPRVLSRHRRHSSAEMVPVGESFRERSADGFPEFSRDFWISHRLRDPVTTSHGNCV